MEYLKKILESSKGGSFAYPREVWWCCLGLNIGTEADGKNQMFERPVLILKVYNSTSIFIVPLTTKVKIDRFHYSLKKTGTEQQSFAKLTQGRVLSSKRLILKIRTISEDEFKKIIEAFKSCF